MDQFSLQIPLAFIQERTALNWTEVLFGIENQLIKPSLAIDLAIQNLESADDSENLAALAAQAADDPVVELVQKLAADEQPTNAEDIQRKWLYLTLAWAYEGRENLSDALGTVETIYADFDYPESIESFIRYMPSDAPDLGSVSLNEERMMQNWEDYLRAESAHFKP
jgi:hypothetical protein